MVETPIVMRGKRGNRPFVDSLYALAYSLAAVFGAIAQLGERLHGMQEVGGSIPPSSTRFIHPYNVNICVPIV